MKNKILFLLLILCPLIYAHETDNPEVSQNQTVTICKYAGSATGALIGGVAGYILKKRMAFFVWNHSGLHTHKATNLQSAAAGAGDGLVEACCELGGLLAGYTAGDKLGTRFGLWLTKH